MEGTVKWFNAQKGYGFITDSEGKDLFVHQSNIKMDGFRHLNEDDIVGFEIETCKDGRKQAVKVKPMITMKMIEDSLKGDNLHVVMRKSSKHTAKMNTLGMDKSYMVVDENNVIRHGEGGMSFLDLAAYAGFEIKQYVA